MLGWQIKLVGFLIVLSSVCSGAYVWHNQQIKLQVQKAVQELNLEHAKEITRLTTKASKVSLGLQQQVKEQQDDKQKQVTLLNAKYSDLLGWVRSQPGSNTGTSNLPGSTSNAEVRSEDVIGELRRRHAIDLAGYASKTETLKLEVLACYRQYDTVKQALDKYRADNTPKTDLKP